MTDAEWTAKIYSALSYYYAPPHYASVKEARIGTGYRGLAERRIDFLAISASGGNLVYAIEVKASRGDFLKDLKQPQKQKAARNFANYFYYAAPKGLIKPEELPAWAGLFAVYDTGEGYIATEAPLLEREAPTWSFVASIIRKLDPTQAPMKDGVWANRKDLLNE
jgi:hypothetical protein